MEKTPFILKELSVYKMPGLPRGLPVYKEFALNINIIYGANGSGKSSTVRAILQLLWRHQTGSIQADIALAIGSNHWDIKLDGAKYVTQRNGLNESLAGLPTVEQSERYQLALHELINNDDQELAREIIKESIGGYDLEQASRELGYTAAAKSKASSEYKIYSATNTEYDRLKKEQEELKREEEQLVPLKRAKEQAEKARELKYWYEKLSYYLDADLKLKEARAALATFPEILEKVTGEEYNAIIDLEGQLETIGRTIQNAEEKIEEQRKLIGGLNLPPAGISATVIIEIEDRVSLLENGERELRLCNEALEEAMVKELQALGQIGESQDLDEWKGLTATDISRLSEFLQKVHLTFSEKQAIESLIEALQQEAPDGASLAGDQLNAGIRALSYWLQQYQESGLLPRWWLWVLTTLTIATSICVYIFGPWGFWGLAAVVACAFFARNKRHLPISAQDDYKATNLEQPLSWSREDVIKKMDELAVRLKEASWLERVRIKIELYQKELKNLHPRMQEIEREHASLEETVKLMPATPDENLKGFDALFWYLKHVQQWQDNHTSVLQLKTRKDKIAEYIKSNLERINELLAACNAQGITDAPSAKAVFKTLKQLDNVWQAATTEIEHLQSKTGQSQQQQEDADNKLKSIYIKLSIGSGEKEQVRQLVLQLQSYKQAKEDTQTEFRIFSEKEQELKTHVLYNELALAIEDAHQTEVQEKIMELSAKVSTLEQVNRQIAEIETKIVLKKGGNSLEAAYHKREEALDGLSEMFDASLSVITGKLLIDRLKKLAGDENQPPVFRRAKAIFSQVTNGRYELIVQQGMTPSFKAYDTVNKIGQELSELSTGTRTQLLLAVRLGFIEVMETSYRLPVLADELLASSDDHRSQAIIEALSEISRQGRQIFYFTAQAEEVSKWKAFLDSNSGISYKIFELDGRSNETTNHWAIEPDFPFLKFLSEVPDPTGKTHAEYGKVLQVDRFNILMEAPEALHLWYLVEDTSVLATLLKRGLSKWGQLKTFIEYGGKLPVNGELLIKQMTGKTELLKRYKDLYRQGRPIPIDRGILEQSKVVSVRFVDALADKLNQLNGNPKQLIDALRNREVARFSSSNIDDLEQFFIEQGYIDSQDIISHDDIILRMNAFLSHIELNPADAHQFIKRIIF